MGSRVRKSELSFSFVNNKKRAFDALDACCSELAMTGVTEGYITDRSDSAQSSGRAFNRTTSQPHTSFSGYPIFQSSFDTLRAVYAHPNITGIPDGPSVLKRPRAGAMIDEEVSGELDDDQEMEKGAVRSDSELKAAMTSENATVLRPMKPLRRTARPFRQTQSLPAAVFGSSLVSGNQKGAGFFTKGSCHEEEDDWSAANFPDSQGQTRK